MNDTMNSVYRTQNKIALRMSMYRIFGMILSGLGGAEYCKDKVSSWFVMLTIELSVKW